MEGSEGDIGGGSAADEYHEDDLPGERLLVRIVSRFKDIA